MSQQSPSTNCEASQPAPPLGLATAETADTQSTTSSSSSVSQAELRAVSRRFRRELHAEPRPQIVSASLNVPPGEAQPVVAGQGGPHGWATADATAQGIPSDQPRKTRSTFLSSLERYHSRQTEASSNHESSNLGTSTARDSSVSVILRGAARHGRPRDIKEKVSAFSDVEHDPCVIDPLSHQRRYWDLYILFLLFYVATVSVYVFSFLGVLNLSSPFFWIERVIDLSFVVDIALSFFTAYETPTGGWETSRPRIAKHYLTHWFVPDVISSIPWDIIGLARGEADAGPTPLLLPRYLRVFRVVKIVKLLRLMRMKQSFTWFEVRFRIRYAQIRLIRLAVSILFVAHWSACLFFFFGSLSPSGSPSWIGQDGVPTNLYGLYVAALYFSTKTISTVGYGDITPENTLERFYVIFLMFVGAAVFATTVSQVGSIVQDQSSSATLHRNQLDQVIELARSRNLPEKLVFDIRRFFQHRRRLLLAEGDDALLHAMSRDLRTRVLSFIFAGSLERSQLFANEAEAIRETIYPYMKKTLHNPGEVVYKIGSPSDSMFSIISGTVRIVSEVGAVTFMGPKDVFGERDLLFRRPRRVTATCVDYCELAVGPADQVIEALSQTHPETLARLRDEESHILWARVFDRADHELRIWRMAQKVRQAAKKVASRTHRLQVPKQDGHTSPSPSSSEDGRDTPANEYDTVAGAPTSTEAHMSHIAQISETDLTEALEMDHATLVEAYVARGQKLALLEEKSRLVFEKIATLHQQSSHIYPLGDA